MRECQNDIPDSPYNMEVSMNQNVISYDSEYDVLTCTCKNTVESDGFYPADQYGVEIEPTINGEWDGSTWVCARCLALCHFTFTEPRVGQPVMIEPLEIELGDGNPACDLGVCDCPEIDHV
jgi:hypothetical protein